MSLPKVLKTAQIAQMLSTESHPWTARDVRRLLKSSGCLTKVGNRYVTTPSMLMDAAGPVAQELFFQTFESREL